MLRVHRRPSPLPRRPRARTFRRCAASPLPPPPAAPRPRHCWQACTRTRWAGSCSSRASAAARAACSARARLGAPASSTSEAPISNQRDHGDAMPSRADSIRGSAPLKLTTAVPLPRCFCGVSPVEADAHVHGSTQGVRCARPPPMIEARSPHPGANLSSHANCAAYVWLWASRLLIFSL